MLLSFWTKLIFLYGVVASLPQNNYIWLWNESSRCIVKEPHNPVTNLNCPKRAGSPSELKLISTYRLIKNLSFKSLTFSHSTFRKVCLVFSLVISRVCWFDFSKVPGFRSISKSAEFFCLIKCLYANTL